MTTETKILTDERIFALAAETDIASIDPKIDVLMFSRDEMLKAARAIEQAVLQSPEIQALRDRIKALEDSLRPFAREFEAWDGVGVWDEMTLSAMYDEAPGEASIPTFGDLRRAAAELGLT